MIPTLLTFHLLLFGIKLWAMIALATQYKKYPYMLLWSIIYLFAETWFLHKFFIDIDMGFYEIFSIIDQVVFTIGLVFYLVKEAKHGQRSN